MSIWLVVLIIAIVVVLVLVLGRRRWRITRRRWWHRERAAQEETGAWRLGPKKMPAERDAQSTGQYPSLVGSGARPWLRRCSCVPWLSLYTHLTLPTIERCRSRWSPY